jgi:hypothetical protein
MPQPAVASVDGDGTGPAAARADPASEPASLTPVEARADGSAPTDPISEPTSEPVENAPLSPLAKQVLRHANRLHKVLRAGGRTELAERVHHESDRWKDDRTNLVIAGDVKRGKSSLLNALVGMPGLLPVDADVATAVHLLVSYGPELTVEISRATDDDRLETFPIDPADLVHYASMAGDPARRQGVRRVDIGAPSPLLERGLRLIDTPGVGGMTRGHKDITLASLGLADALLFAVSSQEPILRSELEFLLEASSRIDSVIFVLTKADLTTDIDRMVDENREKIRTFVEQLRAEAATAPERAEQAERLTRLLGAPFVPVSAKLAEDARVRAAAGRTERAADLRRRSGLPRLERFIDATLATREAVRLSNILQVGDGVLATMRSDLASTARVMSGDFSLEDELRAEQTTLEEMVTKQARWRQRLGTRTQRLQAELNQAVTRETSRIERTYREHLEARSKDAKGLLQALPSDLEATMQASWSDLSNIVQAGITAALAEAVDDLQLEDVHIMLDDLKMPSRVSELSSSDQALANAGAYNMVEDGVPAMMQTFMFGSIVGRIVPLMLGATGPAAVPFLIGGVLSVALVGMRKKVKLNNASRNEYLRVVREAAGVLGQEFRGASALQLVEARAAIEETIDDRIRARRSDIEGRRKELSLLLKQEAASRQKLQKEAEASLAEVTTLSSEAADLRRQVYAEFEHPVHR